jgi:hypothetical protein
MSRKTGIRREVVSEEAEEVEEDPEEGSIETDLELVPQTEDGDFLLQHVVGGSKIGVRPVAGLVIVA